MCYKMTEHPDITRIERDGYAEQPTFALTCSTCGDELREGELYGAYNGEIICARCALDKISNLPDIEILDILGYKPERVVY